MARKEEATGKKLGGKPPKAPEPGARDSDQSNLTDEESRILPMAGGGFEPAYNAQTGGCGDNAGGGSRRDASPHDQEPVGPMLATLKAPAEMLGPVESLLADSGYCREKNIPACEAAAIDSVIAVAREAHPPDWRERHSEPPSLPENAPRAGPVASFEDPSRTSAPSLRKQSVEPVFGILKSVMGFRQFSLRGLKQVTGEWTRVCLAWNLKRMAKLRPQ